MTHSEAEDTRVTELALAAGKGDRRALEEFVRATQRDVWRFLAHLAGVPAADDLAQETYLRAVRAVRTFRGTATARTWLLSIARRVVVDQIRSERARPRTVAADWVRAAESGGRAGRGFEELVEVNVLLDALTPDRREALVLTQVLGLSYQEAAEVSGCELGTVRSRVARAREDLLARSRGQDTGTG
ncbi:sigma-70 family RNA polymerase sigma factor [Saccharopolyspora gloriosae]|uniref:RNA polymerase sigma-70 factor (ECF subfamily) n=1 Tax=Saccharopolyspora gloriosae TaxID=455344 RepID=A0A840N975_9PSEU|nr:RNA polymerase sigma-70 factor (ECF subfamily) [Saccharopolyspora gloriosae]